MNNMCKICMHRSTDFTCKQNVSMVAGLLNSINTKTTDMQAATAMVKEITVYSQPQHTH